MCREDLLAGELSGGEGTGETGGLGVDGAGECEPGVMGGIALGCLLAATVRVGEGGNYVYWLGQQPPRSCRRQPHFGTCRVRDDNMGLETTGHTMLI
jgi:hypothetical protein